MSAPEPIRDIVQRERESIQRIARAHRATRIRIFGSVARGTDGPESDLDLLVAMEPDATFFDLVAMEEEIEKLIGVPVQVVSERGLKPSVVDMILREAVPV